MPPKSEWIFLRGLGRESGHWGDFPSQFVKFIPGAQVMCLDLPGTGSRLSETSPTTIPEIVDRIREQWLAKRDQSQALRYILGTSLGGMVGLDWISRFPTDFSGAVFINTSAGGTSTQFERMTLKGMLGLLTAVTKRDDKERERAIMKVVSNKPDSDGKILRNWHEIRVQRPVLGRTVLNQIRAATLWQAPDRPPKTPLLLIRGLGDRLVSPRCTAALMEKWKCQMESHPTGGHELAEDEPEWVGKVVANWLSKISP